MKQTSKQYQSLLRKFRRALKQGGMPVLMNSLFGEGGWAYDKAEHLWIAPDRKYLGPGRKYYCVRENGDWFKAYFPEGDYQ